MLMHVYRVIQVSMLICVYLVKQEIYGLVKGA